VVKATGVRLLLCEECDTAWFCKEDIGVTAMFFPEYMQSQGLMGLWSEIERLPVQFPKRGEGD